MPETGLLLEVAAGQLAPMLQAASAPGRRPQLMTLMSSADSGRTSSKGEAGSWLATHDAMPDPKLTAGLPRPGGGGAAGAGRYSNSGNMSLRDRDSDPLGQQSSARPVTPSGGGQSVGTGMDGGRMTLSSQQPDMSRGTSSSQQLVHSRGTSASQQVGTPHGLAFNISLPMSE